MKSNLTTALALVALLVACAALAVAWNSEGGSTATGGDGSAAASNCDPNYAGACVPTGNDDVNCADVQETDIHVVGKDPYGLDGDGDGTACESPY